jgi:hypothetical protein
LIREAAAVAASCSPYVHPRLATIEAKITQEVTVMTEDERRQQARELIREAFAERPLKLIEGEVIEADAAETLATERGVMGESMGSAATLKLTPWKTRKDSFS